MIISKIITSSSSPDQFKAPRGTMYEIWNIFMMVTGAGDGFFSVLNYLTEEITTTVDILNKEGVIATMNASIIGQTETFHFTKGERAKFLSLVSAANGGVFVIIHYDLIKASRSDLLWEWFRKGR